MELVEVMRLAGVNDVFKYVLIAIGGFSINIKFNMKILKI
jgi:hypothetical protein